MDRSTRLAIRNEIAELAILREALRQFGVEHAVARRTLMQLQVTVDEIVSNIIKYAWPGGGAHEVSVCMTARDDGIRIEVIDDGQPFDPRTVPPPEQSRSGRRRKPGGLGLHMVKQLVDDIEYFRSGGCNHIVLTKRYRAHNRPQGS